MWDASVLVLHHCCPFEETLSTPLPSQAGRCRHVKTLRESDDSVLSCCSFVRGGDSLLLGTTSGTVQLYNATSSHDLVDVFDCHRSPVRGLKVASRPVASSHSWSFTYCYPLCMLISVGTVSLKIFTRVPPGTVRSILIKKVPENLAGILLYI